MTHESDSQAGKTPAERGAAYVSPKLTEFGSVTSLTQTGTGSKADANQTMMTQ